MYANKNLSAVTERTQRQNDWAGAVVFGGVDKKDEGVSVGGPRRSENKYHSRKHLFSKCYANIVSSTETSRNDL